MTIDEAVVALIDDFSIGDYVYNVRASADLSQLKDGQSSWDHPRVMKFSEAIVVLTERAQQIKRTT